MINNSYRKVVTSDPELALSVGLVYLIMIHDFSLNRESVPILIA